MAKYEVTEDEMSQMTSPTLQSVEGALLKGKEKDGALVPSEQYDLTFRDWLRQLRLQLLFVGFSGAFTWNSRAERPKIAMHRSRRMAVLHGLIHLLPLCGAITLLVFHWTQYWVDFKFSSSTALQFMAKLHETLMQASIVEIMLHIIRTEAVRGFVPLGALSSVAQTTQLSYLWSSDFVSMIASSTLQGWRKLFICTAIPTLLILTALVGPSSAVLMIPRPGSQYIYDIDTRYFSKSYHQYPSHFNSTNQLNIDIWSVNNSLRMEYGQLGTISESNSGITKNTDFAYLKEEDTYARLLRFATMGNGSNVGSTSNNHKSLDLGMIATVPTKFSLGTMRRLRRSKQDLYSLWQSYQNVTMSMMAAHPVVEAKCTRKLGPWTGASTNIHYLQDDGTSAILTNLSALVQDVHGPSEVSTPDDVLPMQFFPPVWLSSPEVGSTSLIGVFLTWYLGENNPAISSLEWLVTEGTIRDLDLERNLIVEVCTVSAYWTIGEERATSSEKPNGKLMQTELLSTMERHNAVPITLDPTCITASQSMELRRAVNHPSSLSLPAAFALAISEYPAYYDSVDFYDPPGGDTSDAFAFTFITTLYGYGYGTTSVSVKLSFATILVYCIVTILYIIYTLITGSTSTAWSSAVELVALALQSERSDHLRHTSVGIDSLKTFKQGVGIRINKDDALELVFESDADTRHMRKIEKNKAY